MKREITLHRRSEAVREVVDSLTNVQPSFSTGMRKLDKAMGGGLYPGKSYGIQARKKIGKTIFMGTISRNLNYQDIPHLWIALEMNSVELEQRQIARDLKIQSLRFLNHDKELADQVKAYSMDAPDNTIYANASGITIEGLEETVERAAKDYGIKGFILDYLQLVRSSDTGNRTEHLEYVAQWVSGVVRRLGIWAMVAAQLNQEDNTRGGEGMLLAFDMVFSLKRDKFKSDAWLEMVETRYTPYVNIGSSERAGFKLIQEGPYFQEQ
jgi:replicative DNA helicase